MQLVQCGMGANKGLSRFVVPLYVVSVRSDFAGI